MKLTFEIQGYNITIEETEEGVVVSAMQGDEEVESFTLDMDGGDMDDDMGGMDDEESQIPDGSQELPDEGEIDEIPGEGDEFTPDSEGEGKLESFISFIRKRN